MDHHLRVIYHFSCDDNCGIEMRMTRFLQL